MNKGKKKLMLVILMLVLCVFLVGCQSEDEETDLERAERELEELQRSNEAIQAQIDELQEAWVNYENAQDRLAQFQ